MLTGTGIIAAAIGGLQAPYPNPSAIGPTPSEPSLAENLSEIIIAAIASCRRFEKHNPHDYAERTVRKAAESLLQTNAISDTRPERT